MSPRLLLGPKSITQFLPKQFLEYIIGLQEKLSPPKKETEPAADVNISLNKKGNLVIRVRNRDPKYLTREEFDEVRERLGLPINTLDLALRKREINIRSHEESKAIQKQIRSIPW